MFPGIKTLIRIETTVFLGFLSINLIIRLLLSNTWVGKFLFEILFIALYYRIESFGFCLTSKHSSDLRSIFDSSSNFFTKMGFFSRTRTHRFHSIYKLFTEWSNQRMLFFFWPSLLLLLLNDSSSWFDWALEMAPIQLNYGKFVHR